MPDVSDVPDVVLYEVADRVALITLNRPEARNALSSELRRRLPEVIAQAEEDPEVDVMVLTGADPAFCAGLDLKELGSSAANLGSQTSQASQAAPGRYRGPFPPHRKPIIGAVNGPAITGGLELALACDFLVASERARFADTHARVGVMPGWGLSVELPEAVGFRRAREMSFTGNFVDAETALAWGLVNHVVEHAELLPTARRLALDIAGNDQPGVREVRSIYADVSDRVAERQWEIEATHSRDWIRDFTPERVAERREGIMERGRSQR
jgi:enoyl-CoA hydratase